MANNETRDAVFEKAWQAEMLKYMADTAEWQSIMKSAPFEASFRNGFNAAWQAATEAERAESEAQIAKMYEARKGLVQRPME